MKYFLLAIFSVNLFGYPLVDFSTNDTIFLFLILGTVVFLLVTYLVAVKIRLKSKNVKMFTVKDTNSIDTESFEKSSTYFDLQEVFLYFFKTLNYEAGVRNNVFLVQQEILQHDVQDRQISPFRHFYGDYNNIINAIWHAANLINENVENEVIFIEIRIENFVQGRSILFVDVGICGVFDNTKKELFENFKNPKELTIAEQMHKFQQTINKINEAKYAIKNLNEKINYAITISIPMLTSKCVDNAINIQTINEKVDVLVVHNNIDISKTITNNLNDFGINCIQNQSANGLLNKIEDSSGCNFRAVLIDANLLGLLDEDELHRLVKSQEEYSFKLIAILNNHKSISNIEKIIYDIDCLQLPYTVDNIRVIVNQIKAQQEKIKTKN